MTLDDVQTIVDVRCAVGGDPETAEDYRHDALEQARGEVPNSITYVILSDESPVGRLRVVRVASFIEIAGLQIHPDWQRQGIGATVIKELLHEGSREGVPVELDVEKDNTEAQRLYSRLGFRRIGEDGRDYRMRYQA